MFDFNSYPKYLTVGEKACVKAKKHNKLNFGQTVLIKNMTGNTVTVVPDSDVESRTCFIEAKDLHTNLMPYT